MQKAEIPGTYILEPKFLGYSHKHAVYIHTVQRSKKSWAFKKNPKPDSLTDLLTKRRVENTKPLATCCVG